MGVTGLWGILEPAGKPTRIQALRGKVLAVDVSIWLHQAVKGFRDRDGNPIRNAHLLGVFHRVCKLLSHGIKPVFVFDGGVPVLKKQTMATRKKRKIEAMDKSHDSRKKLIHNLLREQLQRQYLTDLPSAAEIDAEVDRILKAAERKSSQDGAEAQQSDKRKTKSSSTTPKKKISGGDAGFEDDFEKFREKLTENFNNFSIFMSELDEFEDDFDSESGEEEQPRRGLASALRAYDEHFDSIMSPTFDELPLETQHEMLYEMQESRKNNSWGKMDQMPKELKNFSSFQMERLRKRHTLQKKIQSVQKEMGQRHIHLTNFDDLAAFNYEDIPATSDSKQVLVSKTRETGMIYVRSGPAMSAAKVKSEEDVKPGTSKERLIEFEDDFVENWSSDDEDKLTEEQQLQKAIELSLKGEKSEQDEDQDIKEENEAVAAAAIFVKNLAHEAEKQAAARAEELEQVEEIHVEEKPSEIEAVVEVLDKEDVEQISPYAIGEADFQEHQEVKKNAEVVDKIKSSSKGKPYSAIEKEEMDVAGSDDDDFEEVELSVPSTPEVVKAQEKPVLTIEFSKDDKFEEDEDIFAEIFGAKSADDAEIKDEPVMSTERDLEIEPEVVEEMDSDSDFEKVEMPPEVEQLEDEEDKDEETEGEERKLERTLGTDPTKSVKMISTKYMQAQEKLNKEKEELRSAAGFQERIATSITDQMYTEAQELLSLFGVPYIVSPMEAESQCAFLDIACLTEGTITDDSDVWLFGAQRVYKNFFSQGDRPVQLYEYADIVQKLNLDREKLILIALLTGSDYTDGVEGVGPVKALEILSEFPSNSTSALGTLIAFREWWEKAQQDKKLDADNKVRSKFRNLKLRPGFPNPAVWDAYMSPTIDESLERFRWGSPDLDALRGYTKSRFGWNHQKADAALLPLIKSLSCQPQEKSRRQLVLDSFLEIGRMEKNLEVHGGKRKNKSKRLHQAMKKLKGAKSSSEVQLSDSDSDSEDFQEPQQIQSKAKEPRQIENKTKEPRQVQKRMAAPMETSEVNDSPTEEEKELDELLVKMGVRKMTVKRGSATTSSNSNNDSRNGNRIPDKRLPRVSAAGSTSSSSNSSPVLRPEPVVRSPIPIPTPTKKPQIAPQRARAEFQKELNKKKAIEILKSKKK